jgi:serine phosphatase RsbU (regulator of sigma subunit)
MSQIDNVPAHQIEALLEVGLLLTVTPDIDLLFLRITQAVTAILDCQRASIFLHDPERNELWTKVALHSEEIRIPATAGIAGHSFTENRVINVPDAYQDKRFFSEPDGNTGLTRTLLTVPMLDLAGNPVGVLQALNHNSGPFDRSDEVMLQLLANQTAVAFQRWRLQIAAVEAARLQREMELAKNVQLALIPKVPWNLSWVETDGWMQSADSTGGDGFDLWCTRSGKLGIFLGDASGHGLAPALIIAQVRALVRTLSEINSDPCWILAAINARLAEDLEKDRFVTAFLGFLTEQGRLEWCSAGQGPFFLRTSIDSPLQVLGASTLPLTVMPNIESDIPEHAQMEPGGTLTIVSDGIVEAFDPCRNQFGSMRVSRLLDAHRHSPLGDFITAMRTAVENWQGSTPPKDDQTIVVVRRSSAAKSQNSAP